MNELQASLSPTSLPCNSETDPADVMFWSLQLTVANVSGAVVDLSASELRIELVVDPAGTTGTAGSLILAQYATSVSVAPATGIAWSVTQAQDAPCAFLVSPDSGQLDVGEQAIFSITGIAVDLMQGLSYVTVTVVPPGGPTVANTPAVNKTAPVLAATFAAEPQHLIPPANHTVLTWSTIGAGTCQLSWDQSSAQLTYDGSPLQATQQGNGFIAPVPRQATGATDSPPVTAELFDTTQFTLTVVGTVTLTPPPAQVVIVDPATFRSSSNLVYPYQYFVLTWSCLNDTGPSLSWQSDDPNAIFSIWTGNVQPISQGSPLPAVSGSAIVQIMYPVTFTLNMAAAAKAVPPVPVNVSPLQLSSFTASAPYPVPDSLGLQGVTLNWTARNASGFTLTGTDGTNIQPAYTASGTDLYLPMKTGFPAIPEPVTYTLTARGYPDPITATPVTVNPSTVTLDSFSASAFSVKQGQTATLHWSATAATCFTLAGQTLLPNATSWPTPPLYATTTFEITAYGYTPDGTLPTKKLTINVPKGTGKEGLEKHLSKDNLPEYPRATPAEPAADLPGGSQQAFITSDERPDVGAGLSGADPGSPPGPQG